MPSDPTPAAPSPVQAIQGRRVDWIERAAVGMSTLCLVHCLALPVLLALLPGVSAWLHLPADLHRWLLMFAIPSSSFALLSGCRVHRSAGPLLTGIAGLSLMALAALLLEGTAREVPVSVAGSLLLVAAHVSNWRARHRQCGCQ
ncbi:MerC domain-containing protein [Sphingomonas sp. RS6]